MLAEEILRMRYTITGQFSEGDTYPGSDHIWSVINDDRGVYIQNGDGFFNTIMKYISLESGHGEIFENEGQGSVIDSWYGYKEPLIESPVNCVNDKGGVSVRISTNTIIEFPTKEEYDLWRKNLL